MANKNEKIKVFSAKFNSLMHTEDFTNNQDFDVECDIDGSIGSFDNLNDANTCAHEHRISNPSHKVTVFTTQS